MNKKSLLINFTVRSLTLIASITALGCSYIYDRYGESCNSHAYLNRILPEHISSRFFRNAPVRMAIIPFSVPANLAALNTESTGLGNDLAWQIHAAILNSGEVPIVEVLNRQDWPAKKEEFFTGNFGALSMAREAGYDLVMVGFVEKQTSLDSLAAFSKVLDVDSGVTVWYGKTTAFTRRRNFDNLSWNFRMSNEDPSLMYNGPLIQKTSQCIANAVVSDVGEEEEIEGNY